MSSRSLAHHVPLALVVAISACGGGSSKPPTTPTTTPTPLPRVRSVVSEGSEGDIGVNQLLYVGFVTAVAGELDVTVDWTYPNDGIHVFVSANQCSVEDINAGRCNFIVNSPPSSVKPRRQVVTGVAAGPYTLYVGNRGPEIEAVSWQVGLTTGGSASTGVGAQSTAERASSGGGWSRLPPR